MLPLERTNNSTKRLSSEERYANRGKRKFPSILEAHPLHSIVVMVYSPPQWLQLAPPILGRFIIFPQPEESENLSNRTT
jgi:hypothetical protein